MMKFVFALVVLWHLCYSTHIDPNLNNEMIDGLINISSAKVVNSSLHRVPTRQMRQNAPSCVTVFVRELRKLLNNVTVPEDKMTILHQLHANLDALEGRQGNRQIPSANCRMERKLNTSLPFAQYINFLKKLNSSKKK